MTGDRVLNYKGYCGSIEIDLESGMLYGKIEFINDLVTYTAETLPALDREFQAAVEDYLETCAAVGKDPEKTLSGTMNVRIGPERHKKVALAALKHGTSINDEIKKAIDSHFSEATSQVHIHYHEVREETVEYKTGKTQYPVVEQRIQRH